jgi:hypothetical protein
MKKIISVVAALLLALSALTVIGTADRVIKVTATGTYAKPIIRITMPKTMSFIFNPYGYDVKVTAKTNGLIDRTGSPSRVICSYVDSEDDSWVITNVSDVAIQTRVYAYINNAPSSTFSVRDANINTVDSGDEECKYLFLDIKASGGSSGVQNVVLLNSDLSTDEGENSRYMLKSWSGKADWHAEENEGLITVIHDVPINGKVGLSMTGTTQNVGDLAWSKSDKVVINFVFCFDPEPV